MSSYNAAQVRFNACLQSVAGLVPQLEAEGERIRAAMLQQVADRMRVPAAISLRDLESTWTAVASAIPGHERALATVAGVELRRAQDLRAKALAGTSDADRIGAAAVAELRTALLAGAYGLGRKERLIVATIAAQASVNLGYTVTRYDGEATTGIEARRGHEVIAMSIEDRGAMEFDHAGLTDNTCLNRQSDLEGEMARLGVDLVVTTRVAHGDYRGGGLIAAAAARQRESLAHGVVGAKETASIFAPRTPQRPPDSTRRIGEKP
jgi:hypothetical protein